MKKNIEFNLLKISGSDALTFLQGQLTCDMQSITHAPSFGAYCDIRGRMLANFMIEAADNGFYLWLPNGLRDIFMETLQKYAAFSDVALQATDDATPTFNTNRLKYIEDGIAWLTPATSAKFTPQMINWEKFDGVSFTKGCFLGQEVVARTQHLGKLKRHLYHIQASGDAAPDAGEAIQLDDKPVGIVCDAMLRDGRVIGLAVIEDRASKEALSLPGVDQIEVVLI